MQLVLDRYNDNAPCREQALRELLEIVPSFVEVFADGYYQGDLVVVELIKQKISWGEANKRRMVVINDFKAKIQEAGRQIDRELNASHEAELRQRQSALYALESLSNLAAQQATIAQRQQIINNLNRPITTSCVNSRSILAARRNSLQSSFAIQTGMGQGFDRRFTCFKYIAYGAH